MTPEKRELVHGLVVLPPSGRRRVSKEEFAESFPDALDGDKLSLHILNDAYSEKNAENLQCALIIGHVFGFSSEHEDILCRLVLDDWHTSHEDVVSALVQGGFKDDRAIDALYDATQFVPTYLEYDNSRAFAVKAIWALGKIPGQYSEDKLETLANSPSPCLRQAAEGQLKRRNYELR